jgi:hypothetical protein
MTRQHGSSGSVLEAVIGYAPVVDGDWTSGSHSSERQGLSMGAGPIYSDAWLPRRHDRWSGVMIAWPKLAQDAIGDCRLVSPSLSSSRLGLPGWSRRRGGRPQRR